MKITEYCSGCMSHTVCDHKGRCQRNMPLDAYVGKTEAQRRKERPIYSGVVKYFPRALACVAGVSFVGNEQHNPGAPLHWDRNKSQDELDALMRHLADHASGEVFDSDNQRHLAKVAWRALAMLEKELEDGHRKTASTD